MEPVTLTALYLASTMLSTMYGMQRNRREQQKARQRLEDQRKKGSGHLVNSKSTGVAKALNYGRIRVGLNWTYLYSSGNRNKYLHIIGDIGEGPIHGIVRQDGTAFTDTATEFPSSNPPLLYLDGELWTTKWSDHVYAEFFDGSATQNVCATLAAATTAQEWTHPKRRTAYLYVRLEYDPDKFQQIPELTVEIFGLKLYDPTADSIAYSNNFALMAYDMLTRPSTRGGLGLDNWHAAPPADPRIDIASFETARAYCATKGWAGGIRIDDPQLYFADQFALVTDCFRGEPIYSEALLKMRFRDLNHESIALDVAEEDVVVDGSGRSTLRIRPRADLFDLPNAIEVEFFNSDLKYHRDKYQVTDSTALSADGDMRKITRSLLGLNTLDAVQPMAGYYLERERYGHTADLQLRDAFYELEVMDVIRLTHSMPGWDDRPLRIVGMSIEGNTVALRCEEEDEDLYDDLYNPSALTWKTTSYPNPSDAVSGVINVTIVEEQVGVRLRSYTRIVVDFDAPAEATYAWWEYAEIWLRIDRDIDGTWTEGDWRYMTRSENGYVIEGVEEGATYNVKIRSVNIWGGKEDFDNAYVASLQVIGVDDSPSDLSSVTAVANGDSVSIYATPLDDDDIDGYEIRLGSAWLGALFVSYNKAPSLRLNGVRPGTHTFWMSPKGNNGLYSANPVSAACRVFVPPGFTSAHTWEWDYTTGTFDNAEMEVYDSDNCLRCSHTDDVLTGTWTSATYDMGSIKTVRTWGDFLTVLVASTSTWDGVVPDPYTWNDISAASLSWAKIFAPSAAATVQATLQYSEDNVTYTDVDWFEILCAECYARYIKVVITITDPNSESVIYIRPLNMAAYTGPS
jgi:hypothetical protein